MQTSRFLSFLFMFLVLLSGCDKKEEEVKPDQTNNTNDPTNLAGAGQMIAEINGKPWTSQAAYVGTASPNGITIYGQGNGKVIYLTLGGSITKPGRFDSFAYNSVAGWYTETANGTANTWTSITTNECQVIITKLDWAAKKMSGKFSFVADSQAASSATGRFSITNGSFTDLPINVAAPAATVKMEALVNNVPWSASGMYIYGSPGFQQLYGTDLNGNVIMVSGIDLQTGTIVNANSWATFSQPANNDFDFWVTPNADLPALQITSYDPIAKKASGTFSFNGSSHGSGNPTGTKTVTQGTFTDVPVF